MVKTDVNNPFAPAPIFYKGRTDSTMHDIVTMREYGHGAVLFTGFQEKGRGRISGRKWVSESDQNLLMTLQLESGLMKHPPYRIPLLTGLGISELLSKKYDLESRIKWPNDILVDGKKISGILCESRKGFIDVGIGLNCLQRNFEGDFQQSSTSIAQNTEKECSPQIVLSSLLAELRAVYESLDWKNKINARLYGLNKVVVLREGSAEEGKDIPVRIEGLSEEGFLSVKELSSGASRTILAGEIRFPHYHSGEFS